MKVVDGESVGELVRTARGRLSATAKARVEQLGIPVEGKLAAAYPADAWAACVRLMAEELFPGVEPLEAQRQLARARMAQTRWSVKVLLAISRLAPPAKVLERFVTGLRAGASYIDTHFTVLGPKHYEIWISDVTGVPGFFMGMLEAGAQRATGKLPAMSIKAQDGDACTYDMH